MQGFLGAGVSIACWLADKARCAVSRTCMAQDKIVSRAGCCGCPNYTNEEA